MRRWVRCRLGPIAALLAALSVSVPTPASADAAAASPPESNEQAALAAIGLALYREGRLPSGVPLRARVQGDIEATAEQFTCQQCHRRSGLGWSEGGQTAPAVTGPALFSPRTPELRVAFRSAAVAGSQRPAYDTTSLARVLREGIDPAGRQLSKTMPRYRIDDLGVRALAAYLATLTTRVSPGVDAERIHLATLVHEAVPRARRDAMLGVLERFVRDKNALTRNETGRARHSPFFRDFAYESYRAWQLHVWKLSGAEESWSAQLEAQYAEQPVFALLAGASVGSWRPIHGFCEHHELPCILPLTERPALRPDDFYTIYFSRGVALEAEVLAQHLAKQSGRAPLVIQIARRGGAGEEAATALQRVSLERAFDLETRWIERDASLQALLGTRMRKQPPDTHLVLWLGRADFAQLDAVLSGFPGRLVVSASMLNDDLSPLPPRWRPRTKVLWTHRLPAHDSRELLRERQWFESRAIPGGDETAALDTLYAAKLVGGAIRHLAGNFSRDYLIERIEHAVDTAVHHSSHPRLSLGPGQRFASKGGYVMRLRDTDPIELEPIGDLIVP